MNLSNITINDGKILKNILECNSKQLLKNLINKAVQTKKQYCKNIVYLRGLIEFSNLCPRNCYYCGIRKDNKKIKKYTISEKEIIPIIKEAYTKGYGSIVLQAGERRDQIFIKQIDRIICKTKQLSNGELGITLSLGEQDYNVYKIWYESGAERYLLRIESSDEKLYKKLHPNDNLHSFTNRLIALEHLKTIGYQTGTGVMIGLPFQTPEHLAKDLMFMKNFDIDMCGMGPYIEHQNTPLWQYRNIIPASNKRFELTLKMIALLRILIKDINIAATTAMQTLVPEGRIKAIEAGANVIMPNLTPGHYRDYYNLYENKPTTFEAPKEHLDFLEKKLKTINHTIGLFNQGTSKHFIKRFQK